MPAAPAISETEVATTWFLAARAMAAAGAGTPSPDDAAAGLYGQAILGLSETACREAKRPDRLKVLTLVDCLGKVRLLPRATAEKIVTGALMIALSDRALQSLEIRWASMLASAADLSADDFQRCCAAARIMDTMLHPRSNGSAP